MISEAVLTAVGARIIAAALFLVFASLAINYGGKVIHNILSHKFEEETILNLMESISKGLLWFSATLITLSILGFSEIAAALGTAAGFVALGVSFALKDVLSDTVAGVYLAKDPDFNNGDFVEVDGLKGEITNVGLRKSRLELEDGNLRVINNSDVEKKWTLIRDQ
ncbi:MAG: small-conductance mechanosensitive channel [Candidatus Nanohaloarchaea archaeon]|jgi:small-conductance mechanosensitive channel